MKGKRFIKWVTILVALLLIYSFNNAPPVKLYDDIEVTYIDVGQGDSSFINIKDGPKILIDAGPKSGEDAVLNFLNEKDIKKIDYVIATHPHEDHIGGMTEVLKSFEVGTFYMPEVATTSKTFDNMLDAVKNNGCNAKYAKQGENIIDLQDVKLTVLAPVSETYEDLNNYSVILKLTYKNSSFLFTGDAEKLAEYDVLNSNADIRADILKVAHHGSSTSSGEDFLRKVAPRVGIISCGFDNSYGHPHKETIDTFNKLIIEYFLTNGKGNILVLSDGENYQIIQEGEELWNG